MATAFGAELAVVDLDIYCDPPCVMKVNASHGLKDADRLAGIGIKERPLSLTDGPYLIEGKAHNNGEKEPYFTINGYVNFVSELDVVGCEFHYYGVLKNYLDDSGNTQFKVVRSVKDKVW